MSTHTKFEDAIRLFDEANALDPNKEIVNQKTYPKELIYGIRMTERLNKFNSEASEEVKLAARCQHICRWEIPRESYEMNREGYLKWRKDLAKFHAKKATEILHEVGYDVTVIHNVSSLLKKKQLKKNKETQLLEDVICLVFLEHYFEKFSKKYSEAKLIDIVQKTWSKMSEKGHQEALTIDYSVSALKLIKKAIA